MFNQSVLVNISEIILIIRSLIIVKHTRLRCAQRAFFLIANCQDNLGLACHPKFEIY